MTKQNISSYNCPVSTSCQIYPWQDSPWHQQTLQLSCGMPTFSWTAVQDDISYMSKGVRGYAGLAWEFIYNQSRYRMTQRKAHWFWAKTHGNKTYEKSRCIMAISYSITILHIRHAIVIYTSKSRVQHMFCKWKQRRKGWKVGGHEQRKRWKGEGGCTSDRMAWAWRPLDI